MFDYFAHPRDDLCLIGFDIKCVAVKARLHRVQHGQRPWQAADMGCEYPVYTALHGVSFPVTEDKQ